MQARPRPPVDRTARVPRRWNETLDGIAWLPRLIDKARMSNEGVLGAYLFGHSPFDRALLTRLGATTEEFAAIVAGSDTDAEVLATLRGRGFDEACVRRWSARFPQTARYFIHLWDFDDGYVKPGIVGKTVLLAWRGIERPVMGLLRIIFKKP